MKKQLFTLAAASMLMLAACNSETPAANEAATTPTADTVATAEAVTEEADTVATELDKIKSDLEQSQKDAEAALKELD